MPPKKSALVAAAKAQNSRIPLSSTSTDFTSQSESIDNTDHKSAVDLDTSLFSEPPDSVTARALANSLFADNETPSNQPPPVTLAQQAVGLGSNSRSGSLASGVQSRAGSATRSDGSVPPQAAEGTVQRLKFRPNKPIKRTGEDVKPDAAALSASTSRSSTPMRGTAPLRGGPATRGGPSGRGGMSGASGDRGDRGGRAGRGRGGARGGKPVVQTIAAGVFGGRAAAQTQVSSSARLKYAGGPRAQQETEAEKYSSDEEDPNRQHIIDIDAVSSLNESAPTSLYRDRRTKEEKAAAKLQGKSPAALAKAERKRIRKLRGSAQPVVPQDEGFGVKAEPISPEKQGQPLPRVRDHDVMMEEDEDQDRDEAGRRVRMVAQYGGLPDEPEEEVNAAQAVDLSESESEEEEEGMEGDFVQVEGYDDPEDKLFMFQFPQLFPNFQPRPVEAINVDGENTGDQKPEEDVKPDVKPTAAQLREKRAKEKMVRPPEEGRIGTLVVMKSGRVKMVLGEDIVMNVSPGVPTSFIQQIVHLDPAQKRTNVLGEVHRSYVVTPDIDRLLGELFIAGGQTPGDRQKEMEMKMKLEKGLVKLERD